MAGGSLSATQVPPAMMTWGVSAGGSALAFPQCIVWQFVVLLGGILVFDHGSGVPGHCDLATAGIGIGIGADGLDSGHQRYLCTVVASMMCEYPKNTKRCFYLWSSNMVVELLFNLLCSQDSEQWPYFNVSGFCASTTATSFSFKEISV